MSTTTPAGFGKTKIGNTQFWKRFTLQQPKSEADGPTEAVYRILPPMKSAADDGVWARYFSIHYGFEGRDSKDNTKSRTRTFQCIEESNRKTGEVYVQCPQCEAMRLVEEEMERIAAQAKTEGRTDDEIETLVAAHKQWLHKFNIDRKHYMNVMTEKGEFGVLLLSHKTKTQLEGIMKELLEKENIDATDLENGVFFSFKRSGRNRNVQDTVSVAMTTEVINGKKMQTAKTSQLTADQVKSALEICPDLNLDIMTVLTSEQIGKLVSLGKSPDLDLVDAIFGSSQKRDSRKSDSSKSASTGGGSGIDPAAAAAAHTAAVAKAAADKAAADKAATLAAAEKPVEQPPAEDPVAAQMAALQAQLAALQAAQKPAAPAAVPVTAPVSTPAAAASAATPGKLSNEKFIGLFGAGVTTLPAGDPPAKSEG